MKPENYILTKPLRRDKKLEYEYFIDPDHPLANASGKVYMHRHVASVKLGRWINNHEHVHHINEVKDDNDFENIEILSRNEHGHKHHGFSKVGICKQCKKQFKINGKRRIHCSLPCARISHRKTTRPSAKTLKKEIAHMSWSAIGRKYGVSDNAVRKWARTYKILL